MDSSSSITRFDVIGARLHLTSMRLNIAPDAFMSFIIGPLVVVPVVSTLAIVLPSKVLQDHLDESPYQLMMVQWLTLLLVIFGVAAIVFLAAAVMGDPGIVRPEAEALLQIDTGHTTERLFDPEDEVQCCRICSVHVYRFDHHCGVIGACIGGRNMCFFVLFLVSAGLLSMVGMPIHVINLWCSVKLPTSLTHQGVSNVLSWPLVSSIGCLFAAVQGGAYCCILGATYVYYIVSGRDSTLRRRGYAAGTSSPSTTRFQLLRLKRCLSYVWRWQSAFRVVEEALCSKSSHA